MTRKTSPPHSSPNFPNSSPRSVLTSFSRGSWSSLPKAAFHRAAPRRRPELHHQPAHSLIAPSPLKAPVDDELQRLITAPHCSDSAARVSSLFSRRTRMRIGAAGKWFIAGIIFTTISCASANEQQFDQKLYSEMRWRCIGPFRGGRTVAISGVPYQPNVFYMAAVNGGVWKTTDFGSTWNPIFDDQPTGSVGALAVAPSDPNIIYAGSGEGL